MYADFKCDKCGHIEEDIDVSLAADPNNPIFKSCPKCGATVEDGDWYNKTWMDSFIE